MSGKALAAVGGDPRRPEGARRYPRATASPVDELDTSFIVALLLGLCGYLFKLKLVAWAAVCAVAYGLANLTSATGTQHVISAAMCSVMGLVATYANDGPSGLSALFPPPAQPPAAAAVPDASGLAS